MANKPKTAQSSFNWKLPLGLVVLGGIGYYFTNGSDDSAKPKAPVAAKAASSGPADLYQPGDYTASYQPLKVASKDAFKPLIFKPKMVEDLKEKGLPSSITGGGSWSYNGLVTVDNKVQGLLEETKSGESDFLSLGQHWKHGRVKKITDDEIVFDGDDGSPATLKMGDSSAVASKAPPAPSPNSAFQPPALAGNLDMTPLPSAIGFGGQAGNAAGGGFGGGRRGRGGRNRGGGGGFGGGGF